LYFLTVYCEGDEALTFWFAHETGAKTTLLDRTLLPAVDSNVGTVNAPYMLAESRGAFESNNV
jgi:hypothetical protein